MKYEVHGAFLATALLLGCGGEGQDNPTAANTPLEPAACENPYGVGVPAGCEEAACEMAQCGAPDSFLDEFRCERKQCETNEECGPNEECRWLHYLPPFCGYSEEGVPCRCGSNLMTVDKQLCLPKQ